MGKRFYDSKRSDITVALTGDLMLSRRLSVFTENRFIELRKLLQNAEVVFSNFESTARTYEEGYPNLRKGFMTTEPKLLEDIKWFGINLLACANNHAFDYGEQGILFNISHLNAAGIVHAGTGKNLSEARSPAYLDTASGRVALIAVTSKYDVWHQAGEQRPDCQGRPGVNPLGFQTSFIVDQQAVEELRRIAECLGLEADKKRQSSFGFLSPAEVGIDKGKEYHFLGRKFQIGEKFAVKTELNEKDLTENLKQLHEARRQADWVIVSIHYHDVGGHTFLSARKRTEIEEWADFAHDFAYRCIDEGADIVVGHGPHYALGIELYKGKPIFQSLGNFIFQNETVRILPAHAYTRFNLDHQATPADFFETRSKGDTRSHPSDPLYWQSICAICKFTSGKLARIQLYPLDLGYGKPRSQRGRPLLPDPQTSKKIITRVSKLSEKYGTRISFQNGLGLIANPDF